MSSLLNNKMIELINVGTAKDSKKRDVISTGQDSKKMMVLLQEFKFSKKTRTVC